MIQQMISNKAAVIVWAQAYLAEELSREISDDDLHRSFSEVGLDSLDEMAMIGAIEDHFGIEFDPVALLQYPIIMEMLDAAGTEDIFKKQ